MDAGASVEWNTAFSFEVKGPSSSAISFEIRDDDFTTSELISRQDFTLAELLCNGPGPRYHPMEFEVFVCVFELLSG
jgi:hypothetical protein